MAQRRPRGQRKIHADGGLGRSCNQYDDTADVRRDGNDCTLGDVEKQPYPFDRWLGPDRVAGYRFSLSAGD